MIKENDRKSNLTENRERKILNNGKMMNFFSMEKKLINEMRKKKNL